MTIRIQRLKQLSDQFKKGEINHDKYRAAIVLVLARASRYDLIELAEIIG